MAKIQTSWAFAATSGESLATIRVRNLQTTVEMKNAWGSRWEKQPGLISVSVSLRTPFKTAEEEDAVDASTIHYGTLSKAILEAIGKSSDGNSYPPSSLKEFLDYIGGHLTSFTIDGKSNANPAFINDWKPILDTSMIRSLELKIMLPKASLLGTGVSLVGSCSFSKVDGRPENYSLALHLHSLRVPAIIGVNPNERLAKQIVVADIEVDQWTTTRDDLYPHLEEIVVKTIEESSFQTLEALVGHVGSRVTQYFIIPQWRTEDQEENQNAGEYVEQPHCPRLKICLKKPTAVTLADAPEVEILLDCHFDPRKKSSSPQIIELWGTSNWYPPPPFPLQGRLDEWIRDTRSINDRSSNKPPFDEVS